MKKIFFFLILTFALRAETVVITIHGYMRSHKSMHKLARALDLTVYHFDYPSRTKTINENALTLVGMQP